MRFSFLLFPLFVLSLSASEMLERTQVMMGTFATISLPKEKSIELQKSFELLKAVEASLSSYDPSADIYRLNHNREVNLSTYSYEALNLAKDYYEVSGGYFDITVGSITKELFRFGEDERIPQDQELEKAKIDISGLHFNRQKAWLEKGTAVDLGGMGKGFGVDKAAAYLHEQNIAEGRVALSGDIRCLDSCKMALQNPFGEGTIASFTAKYPNTALSTSGNYRRYVGDKTNNHLVDPKMKRPERTFASITLISRGANSDIDGYATAASVMPREKAIVFLEQRGVGYILILTNGEQIVSA
ncbi:MAG: FAD:protein FMN transferase, partial [Thiovulaceae bacterium]|nr:FAD:protein FMN transferase [Sulfurimonadaceae bacterium]